MPQKSSSKTIASQATFIFRGTVRKLQASTMAAVPAGKNTIVVRVDEVIESLEVLEDYAGHDVTVQLRTGRVKSGQQYTFYSNPEIFGESLVVQAIAHETAVPSALTRAAAKPSSTLRDKLARARFDAADLVVAGLVTSVRVIPEAATAAARGVVPKWKPVSEHDPVTQEAAIQVTAVHKGARGRKEVKLRFPRSTDVRWYQAPKFVVGQQGVFMLHTDEKAAKVAVRGAAVAAALPQADTQGFHTALHPLDFLPLNQAVGVPAMPELHTDEEGEQ